MLWRREDEREESELDPTSAFEDEGSEELAGEVVSWITLAMPDLEVCRGLVVKAR